MLDHQRLRLAIASRLGQVLTPELATAIELEARNLVDRSYNPEQFGQKEYKGLVFRAEKFEEALEELHGLHTLHYEETEKHRAGIPMNPNYELMAERESQGEMIQFTCRDAATGKLVGNIRMYLGESLHTGTLYAVEDTFYVLPEYRLGFAALRFWQFMEDCLKSIGVREIRTDSKVTNKVHRLNEYCGYKHVANKYVKVFQE